MQSLKPAIGSIGTASGVAWPTFGMYSSILGLTAGCIGTYILGSTIIGLFFLVAIPTCVILYKNLYSQKKADAQHFQETQAKINKLISSFLFTLLQRYQLENSFDNTTDDDCEAAMDYIIKKINLEINLLNEREIPSSLKEQKHQLFVTMREYIKNKQPQKFINILIKENTPNRNHDEVKVKNYYSIFAKQPFSPTIPISITHCIQTGFLEFCGAYGTVLGGTAGAAGLLAGIGVFSGIAAIPVIGWVAAGTALLLGLSMAISSAYQTYQKSKVYEQKLAQMESIHSILTETKNTQQCALSYAKGRADVKREERDHHETNENQSIHLPAEAPIPIPTHCLSTNSFFAYSYEKHTPFAVQQPAEDATREDSNHIGCTV